MKPTLVVLAAGMGSRYGGMKQIDSVGPDGEAIIDYSVFDAARAGFGKVVFVIRRDIEKDFRAFVGKRYETTLEVDYAFQQLEDLPGGRSVPTDRTKPWGTAHAVWVCRNAVTTPFAVINADDFYGRSSYEILSEELSSRRPGEEAYSMVGFLLRKTLSPNGSVSRALCEVDSSGYLTDIVEHKKLSPSSTGAVSEVPDGTTLSLTGDELVSMNMFGFTPKVFDRIEAGFAAFIDRRGEDAQAEYYIPDVIGEFIHSHDAAMRVMQSDERWFGVTYREDKPDVETELKKLAEAGEYPRPLWRQVLEAEDQ